MNERNAILALAIWVFLFGIWPIAHPSHTDGSPMAIADLLLHLAGGIHIGYRWATREERSDERRRQDW